MIQRIKFTEAFYTLRSYKEQDDQTSFNLYIQKVIPEITAYIQKQLNIAIERGSIYKGKHKAEEIIDELYIKAYEHIQNIEKSEFFKIWLYRTANQLLSDLITEDQFDEFFFQNIDKLTKSEWAEMEENYSTDGDGDFVMLEELDDISYPKNDYELRDILIEADEEEHIIKDLDDKIGLDRINKHIRMLLPKLPADTASILDLFSQQKLSKEEIADIKNISVKAVQDYLNEARNLIRISLENRYKD